MQPSAIGHGCSTDGAEPKPANHTISLALYRPYIGTPHDPVTHINDEKKLYDEKFMRAGARIFFIAKPPVGVTGSRLTEFLHNKSEALGEENFVWSKLSEGVRECA